MSHEGPCVECGLWAPLDDIEDVCERCWSVLVFKPTWRDRLRWAAPDLFGGFAVLAIAASIVVACVGGK